MIKRINPNLKFEHRHLSDVKRIQKVCMLNGYAVDLEDCATIWDEYSEMYAAGWLGLPDDDDELWLRISSEVVRKAE